MPAPTAGAPEVVSAQSHPSIARRTAATYLASAIVIACCLLPSCGSEPAGANQELMTWADEYCEAGLKYLADSEPLVAAIPYRDEQRNMLDIEQRKERALASIQGSNQVLETYLDTLRSMDQPDDIRWLMDVIINRRERILEVSKEQMTTIQEATNHSDFLLPDLAISIAATDVGYAYIAARQNAPHGSEQRIAAALSEADSCKKNPDLANLPWLPSNGFVAP